MANKRRRSSASSTSPAGAPPHASTGISRKTTDEDETSVGDTALLEGRAFAAASSPSHLSRLIGHQEIFLRVLGFLSASDLASAQGVNRYWQHMSLDPQLWKRLYLSRYPHPHHAKLIYTPPSQPHSNSVSSPSTPRSLRPIARLPSRAFPPPSPTLSSPARHDDNDTADSSSGLRVAGKGKAVPLASAPEEIGTGVRHDGVDWKMMLRLGTNWIHGTASHAETIRLPPSPSPSSSSSSAQLPLPPHLSLDADTSTSIQAGKSEQYIALSPSFIFTSNPTSPLVQVYTVKSPSHSHPQSGSNSEAGISHLGLIPPPPGWSNPSRPDNITAIVSDQSVLSDESNGGPGVNGASSTLPARLAIFYRSGGFVVAKIRITDGRLVWSRESIHPPTSRPMSVRRRATTYHPVQGDPVVLANLHYPVLITCTQAFHLSVYTIPESNGDTPSRPIHLRTLHSDVSFHPAALSLFPSTPDSDILVKSTTTTSNLTFKAALTYCTPLYPSSWTVAIQELSVDLAHSRTVFGESSGQVHRGECYHVGREDEGDANDGDGDDDEGPVWPRRVRPVVGVRGAATGIGSDGRRCVLAGKDEQVLVFSLPFASHQTEEDYGYRRWRRRDKDGVLLHSHSLLTQSLASVTALSLLSGRCVTAGTDGKVLLWNLDSEDGRVAEEEVGTGAGRTVGFVQVRRGKRRRTQGKAKGKGKEKEKDEWRGAAGPAPPLDGYEALRHGGSTDGDGDEVMIGEERLPHPASISAAARAFFLPRPPTNTMGRNNGEDDEAEVEGDAGEEGTIISQVVFDEEKIVGVVREPDGGESLKVWSFS